MVLAVVDLVLIMSVNPGFGGQSFIESQVKKISDLRRLCAEKVCCNNFCLCISGWISCVSPRAFISYTIYLTLPPLRVWIHGLKWMVGLVQQMLTRCRIHYHTFFNSFIFKSDLYCKSLLCAERDGPNGLGNNWCAMCDHALNFYSSNFQYTAIFWPSSPFFG